MLRPGQLGYSGASYIQTGLSGNQGSRWGNGDRGGDPDNTLYGFTNEPLTQQILIDTYSVPGPVRAQQFAMVHGCIRSCPVIWASTWASRGPNCSRRASWTFDFPGFKQH